MKRETHLRIYSKRDEARAQRKRIIIQMSGVWRGGGHIARCIVRCSLSRRRSASAPAALKKGAWAVVGVAGALARSPLLIYFLYIYPREMLQFHMLKGAPEMMLLLLLRQVKRCPLIYILYIYSSTLFRSARLSPTTKPKRQNIHLPSLVYYIYIYIRGVRLWNRAALLD